MKYWGSRLEAADGCTSDECTSDAERRLVGLYFSVLVLFFCQKAVTIRPDLSKCRETGLKMQRKYLRLFCVLLCSNFVKKKRLQLASIAQCASKYTDRKKSHGAFVLSDILFDTLMPFRIF